MKKIKLFLAAILLLALNACQAGLDPKISMAPPAYVEQLAPKEENNTQHPPGSLFGSGDNPLFSDRKAMHVNDIVTVMISENTSQSSNGSKKTSKTNNATLGGGALSAGSGLSFATDQINRYSSLGFKTNSDSSYQGQGSQSRTEKFQTAISARVIKIMSNGNYFIEGSREILIDGEKQIIQLSGVIRPYDISGSNTIDSKYIADAKILYTTQGDIAKATTKPWGTKFFETIWPF